MTLSCQGVAGEEKGELQGPCSLDSQASPQETSPISLVSAANGAGIAHPQETPSYRETVM